MRRSAAAAPLPSRGGAPGHGTPFAVHVAGGDRAGGAELISGHRFGPAIRRVGAAEGRETWLSPIFSLFSFFWPRTVSRTRSLTWAFAGHEGGLRLILYSGIFLSTWPGGSAVPGDAAAEALAQGVRPRLSPGRAAAEARQGVPLRAKAETWPEAVITTITDTTNSAKAETHAWDRVHPRLTPARPGWSTTVNSPSSRAPWSGRRLSISPRNGKHHRFGCGPPRPAPPRQTWICGGRYSSGHSILSTPSGSESRFSAGPPLRSILGRPRTGGPDS